MIIALPTKQSQLVGWMEASFFTRNLIENNQVVKKELVSIGDHAVIAEELYRQQVNRILVPSLDNDLKFDFDYYQIEVILGVQGEVDEVIERFLEGEFEQDE